MPLSLSYESQAGNPCPAIPPVLGSPPPDQFSCTLSLPAIISPKCCECCWPVLLRWDSSPGSGACAGKPDGTNGHGDYLQPGTLQRRGSVARFSPFLPGAHSRCISRVAVGRCWCESCVCRGGQSAAGVLACGCGVGLRPLCSGRCGPRSNPRGQWDLRCSNVRRLDARPMETRLHGCLSLPV